MHRLFPILGPSVGTITIAVALFLIAPYALLVMAPALALAWLVAVGLFTGEQAIAWVRRVARRSRSPLPARASTTGPARQDTPRRGLLIAAALAIRPPPATA